MTCDIQGILMRLPGTTQDLQQTYTFPERQAGGTIEHLKWHVTPLSEYTKWSKPCYLLSLYFCFLIPYSFTTETLPIFKMVPLLIPVSDRFHSWPSGPNDLLSLCNDLGQSLYLELPCCSCTVLEWWRGHVNRILKSIHPTLEMRYCF